MQLTGFIKAVGCWPRLQTSQSSSQPAACGQQCARPASRQVRKTLVPVSCSSGMPTEHTTRRAASHVVDEQQVQSASENDAKPITESATMQRTSRLLDVHHSVFVADSAANIFARAAARHGAELRKTGNFGARLLVGRAAAVPWRGRMQSGSARHQPDFAIFESFTSKQDEIEGASVTERWIRAVGRSGNVLSPQPPQSDEWVRICETRSKHFRSAEQDHSSCILVCESFDSIRADRTAPEEMRKELSEHALRAVTGGNALFYDVLESTACPTFFKSLALYKSVNAFQDHLETLEPDLRRTDCTRLVYRPVVILFN